MWQHQPPTRPGGEHLLWLLDPLGGSWAVARYDLTTSPRRIRQHGPRPLWDEVETAYRAWAAAGKPPVESHTITITPAAQTISPTPPDPPPPRLSRLGPPLPRRPGSE